MIGSVDDTIKVLLEQELGRVLSEAPEISFDTPDQDFKPTTRTVDLFLYDVRENRELRSNEWLVQRQSSGVVTQQRAPVRIDCSYLITAWAGDVHSEHILLGHVMQALLRHPTIPAAVLQGSLAGQEPPLPTSTLQPGRLQSMAEFWQALGGKPRAVLNYTVTVSLTVQEPVTLGPPVVKI